MASEQSLDDGAVLSHYGVVELGVECCVWAFFQRLGTVSDQLPGASLGYVSHEKTLQARTEAVRGTRDGTGRFQSLYDSFGSVLELF